jgi:hypothetical protein
MKSSILLTASFALALAVTSARAARDPIVLPTAVHTLDLSIGHFPTDAPMEVAWYPGFGGRYYATLGGLTSDSAYVFNAAGAVVQRISPIGVDCRSIAWNWNTNKLEVVAFNAKGGGGLWQMCLSPTGNFTGTNSNVLGTLSGLADAQTMPAYDSKRNRLYSRSGSFTVNVVDRAAGSLIGTIQLDTTGLGLQTVAPGGAPSLSGQPIGFDSTYDCLITLDTTRPRFLVHRLDGSFVGASAIPASPAYSPDNTYGLGYANGQVFAFDDNTGKQWNGYRIFNPPNASSASVSTGANTYALIACGVEPVDTTIAGHFGGPDTTAYRFGRYMPDRSAYAMAGTWYAGEGRALSGIHPGEGYWLIRRSAGTTVINGSSTPTTWVLPLVNGPAATPAFNQLGNPFGVALPVSSLRLRSGGTQTYVTAGTNTLTDNVVWTWNGSAYVSQGAGTSIPAGQGFWLRKVTTSAADVIAARPGVNPEPALLAAGAPQTAADPRLWSVSLTAREGETSSNALTVGAAALDRAGLDAISWRIPPAPPGGSLRLVVRDDAADDRAAAFRAAGDPLSWDVVLSGAAAPGEISLDIAATALPAGGGLRLTDRTSGASYALQPGHALTLAAFAGERHFQLEVLTSEMATPAPDATHPFRLAYPNPFRSDVGLTFAIARAGDVGVRIFDLQGRLVRSLERRGLASGEHVLVWDGRNEAGSVAKSGVYLARWSTPSAAGTTRLVKID